MAARIPSSHGRCKAVRWERLLLLSCGVYGNVIRFLFLLTITDEVLEEGLGIVADALTQ
ncbi:hypothetical protein CS8_101390 [Cupriavidus sp. 8B]